MRQTAAIARRMLRKYSSPKNAKAAASFFKTEAGEYGEYDQFIGVRVPDVRKVSREFCDLGLGEIQKLLRSKIHEERLLALVILVNRSKRATASELRLLTSFYLKNLRHVNNWDIVDVSAEHLLGAYLFSQKSLGESKKFLARMARSRDPWVRRVSMIATFYFIRRGGFAPTIEIAKILVNDEHDLIHKAVGWLLREVGKRDLDIEEKFLKKHAAHMPRTMLRYAIERFPERKRLRYLQMGRI